MSKHPLFDEPSEVSAEQGEVVVDGPDGVAVSLTPDGAAQAAGQRLLGRKGNPRSEV